MDFLLLLGGGAGAAPGGEEAVVCYEKLEVDDCAELWGEEEEGGGRIGDVGFGRMGFG